MEPREGFKPPTAGDQSRRSPLAHLGVVLGQVAGDGCPPLRANAQKDSLGITVRPSGPTRATPETRTRTDHVLNVVPLPIGIESRKVRATGDQSRLAGDGRQNARPDLEHREGENPRPVAAGPRYLGLLLAHGGQESNPVSEFWRLVRSPTSTACAGRVVGGGSSPCLR